MIENDLKIIRRVNYLHKNCKVLGRLIKPIDDLYGDTQDSDINQAMACIGSILNSIISDISDVDIKAIWFCSINNYIFDEFVEKIPEDILNNLDKELKDNYMVYADDWLFYSDINFEQYIDKMRKIFNKYEIDYVSHYNENVKSIYNYRGIDDFKF